MRTVTRSSRRKLFVVTLGITVLMWMTTDPAAAQWEPELRLTEAPDSSQTSGHFNSLAVSGDTVHIVWADKRSGNWEIYYRRSVDDGVHWGEEVLLSANGPNRLPYRSLPSLAVSGATVHVVWHNDRTGNYELYYRRSMDGGDTWSAEECLSYDMIWSWVPSIAVLGSTVHLAWSDRRDGNFFTLYYKRSTDDGYSWSEARRLSGNSTPGHAQSPRVNVSDARLYVTWHYWMLGRWNASYRVSVDGGDTWWDENNPADDPEDTDGLTVRQSNPYLYYFWAEKTSDMWNLHYRYSADAGLRWKPEMSLRLQQLDYLYFSCSVTGTTIHLVWKDDMNGFGMIRYTCSTDAGESWEESTDISPLPTGANWPSVALNGSTVHVLWTDYRDGAGEVYYRRNPTGNPVSAGNGAAALPADLTLEQNYPNPFRRSSSIRFTLPVRGQVVLTLHDLLGRQVATVLDAEYQAGTHHARIEADRMPAGSYLIRLSSGGAQRTRLLTVFR